MSEQVTMSAAERAEWEAFKAEKAKKEAAEQRKQQRETYAQMVDDELEQAIPELLNLSGDIKAVKDTVFGNFAAIIDMKSELFGTKDGGQYSPRLRTATAPCASLWGSIPWTATGTRWRTASQWCAPISKVWRPMIRAKRLCRQSCVC